MCVSVCVCVSVCPVLFCLSVYVSVCLSVCLSTHLGRVVVGHDDELARVVHPRGDGDAALLHVEREVLQPHRAERAHVDGQPVRHEACVRKGNVDETDSESLRDDVGSRGHG